jgi:hypothetical protein
MAAAKGRPIGREPSSRYFTLLVGRLHADHFENGLLERVSDAQLEKNLIQALRESKGIEQPPTPKFAGSVWVFGDARREELETGPIIFGRLGRLKHGFEHETYDWDKHEFKTAPIDRQTATGYADFLIDLPLRAIIYEDRRPISDRQFRKYFKRLYEAHTKEYQRIEINPIASKEEIYEFVETLERLTAVSAVVRPSNPEISRDWKGFDDQLRLARAEEARITLTSEHGLNADKTLVSQTVSLAAAGYGKVTVRGQRGDQSVSLTSANKVVREEIGRHRDDPQELVGLFHSRLRQIIRKVVKK